MARRREPWGVKELGSEAKATPWPTGSCGFREVNGISLRTVDVQSMAKFSRAVWGRLLLILLATGWWVSCQRYEDSAGGAGKKKAKPVPSTASASSPASASTSDTKAKKTKREKQPPIRYSPSHDEEINEIFELARKDRWEDAETRANALMARDPQDPAAQRMIDWVKQQRERRREQALENTIRSIEAKQSVFNPTAKKLVSEKKDRGLPARKDVRDAIQQIQATPYVPPSYGKTNYLRGLLFDFESRQGRMAKILEKEVSISLDNTPLEKIIFDLGQAEGINFVADRSLPAFQSKLSVNMTNVTFSEFLRYVSRNLDLQFQIGDELIWIVDGKDPKKVLEETRFYRLRKGFVLPAELGPPEVIRTSSTVGNVTTVTEQQKMAKFVNDLAPHSPSIERAITNFFIGKYQIDYERNIIVARGKPEDLTILEKIIEEFDKPIQQVLIEARFITVSQAAFLRLGVAWETGRATFGAEAAQDFTGIAVGEVATPLGWLMWTNTLGNSQVSAILSALEQSGESQVLSAPRLTLINNLPAVINDGKVQYYYEQYQVKSTILERRSSSQLVPDGKPTKITSGASLNVLASVGGDGNTILLALNPKVNSDVELKAFQTIYDTDDSGNIVSRYDLKLPEYRTQDLSTRVSVRSGQTVVMGGVLERTQTTFVEAVPILGNLPIIGAAFRRRTELDKPRYLLIFVTATLLSETGEYIVYEEASGTNVPRREEPGALSTPDDPK